MVSHRRGAKFLFLHVLCIKLCKQLQMMPAVTKCDNAMCKSCSWLPRQYECVIYKHSVVLLVKQILTNAHADKHKPISICLESTGVPRSLHNSSENCLSSDCDTVKL